MSSFLKKLEKKQEGKAPPIHIHQDVTMKEVDEDMEDEETKDQIKE
jgi:hypothetical protein